MMRHFLLYSTLLFLFLSNPKLDFNYCYHDDSAHVNEINFTFSHFNGKDNHLDHFPKRDFQLKTIVIDAGHGGHDHGCSGAHSKEKYISLKIAKKLGNYIKGRFPKVKVIYTREADVFVPLHTRAKIANDARADLFVSIHCNAIRTQKHLVKGTETYVMGLHTADENFAVAKRENEAILLEKDYKKHYDGFDPNSPEGHIILSMVQNAFLEQSLIFAEKVETNFKQIAGRKSRGVKQAGFVVLKATTMPSVLIESGYLTHKSEEKYLQSDKGQDEMAYSIFKAFESYKKEMEFENSIPATALPARSEQNKLELSDNKPIHISQTKYKVQIASSKKKIKMKSKKWKKLKFPLEIKQENGNFKYLAGDFTSKDQAESARKKLIKAGFKGAFIVILEK